MDGGFLAKFDSWGNLLWLTQPFGPDATEFGDQAFGMVCAPNGDVYLTGGFYKTYSVAGVTLSAGTNLSACFVIKYDGNGNALWAAQSVGAGSDLDSGLQVALDSQTNVYVAGAFESPTIQFGTNVLTNVNEYPGSWGLFLVKYDSAGNVLWAKQAGPIMDEDLGMATDPEGNTYLDGLFSTNVAFGGLSLTNPNPANQRPVFIAKYDPSGNPLWAKAVSASAQSPISLAVDAGGNSYITAGYYSSNASFDNIVLANPHAAPAEYVSAEVFVARYDNAGNALWARQGGGSGDDWGGSIALDASGSCYVTGFLSEERADVIQFDSIALTNLHSQDYYIGGLGFIAKYDSEGDILWAKDFVAQPVTTAVDPLGTVFMAGTLEFTNEMLDSFELVDAYPFISLFMARLDGPQLSAATSGNELWLSWPTNAVGLSLETTANPSSGVWASVTNLPAVNGNQFNVACDITNSAAFFRLNIH